MSGQIWIQTVWNWWFSWRIFQECWQTKIKSRQSAKGFFWLPSYWRWQLSLQSVWKHWLSNVAWDSSFCENCLYVLSHGVTTLKWNTQLITVSPCGEFVISWLCHLIIIIYITLVKQLSFQSVGKKCWKMASFFWKAYTCNIMCGLKVLSWPEGTYFCLPFVLVAHSTINYLYSQVSFVAWVYSVTLLY